jgi:hypothetical protein
MKNNLAIGSREAATITNPIHPTWGTETELCKWDYVTEDGIMVNLTSYGMYPGDDYLVEFSMSVIHTDKKGWNTGDHGSSVSLPAAKRWITRTIRETREKLARRAA